MTVWRQHKGVAEVIQAKYEYTHRLPPALRGINDSYISAHCISRIDHILDFLVNHNCKYIPSFPQQ